MLRELIDNVQQATSTAEHTAMYYIKMEDILRRKKQGKETYYYVRLPAEGNIDRYAWTLAKNITPSIVAKYEAQRSKKRLNALRKRRLGLGQR
jgi:hypothetical protein